MEIHLVGLGFVLDYVLISVTGGTANTLMIAIGVSSAGREVVLEYRLC